MNKKLFVIDLMPLLYKGYFVFLKNPRRTRDGRNTSALTGFANALMAILSEHAPSHVALAMDPEGPTFRHEAFPQYKAQREKMPEDLAANIPYALELAEALGIPVLRCAGFEADDVMGTVAARAAAEGFQTYLVTPDKDAAQLVAPGIFLFRPGKGGEDAEIYDEAKVREHWGLKSVAQMVDWLALAGDAADNIPGIKGVGEKTAQQLLSAYPDLEEIIAHAGELKGKLAERVRDGAESARMSRMLAKIRIDAPVEIDFAAFEWKAPQREKLMPVCAKYELFRFGAKVLGEKIEEAAQTRKYRRLADVPHNYTLVTEECEARKLAEILEGAPKFAFDTETTGTDAHAAELVGISFATEPGRAWYVAMPRRADEPDLFSPNGAADENAAAARRFAALFAAAFADPAKTLIAHNAKYDMTVLERYGIRFGATVRDTMLEHYVADAAASHKMDALACEHLGYEPIHYEEVVGEKKRGEVQKTMADVPPAQVCDYAAEDADVALRLDAALRGQAAGIGALQALEQSEEPLVKILIDMEREGVRIDVEALAKFGMSLEREIAEIVAQIRRFSDPGLNLDSPKQLSEFLFGKLALPATGVKKGQSGAYSTDEATLQKLKDKHPVVADILEYRTCSKLKSTYVDKLPEFIDRRDGRVHTTFAQAFTGTGRLSSSEPNLQNIPVRSERGKFIRAAVVPRDADHVLMAADYSQIELRVMAAMSGDETMLRAFREGADIHRETAARVYGVMPELVSGDMRSKCKMVNFGIIYGISAFGLAERLQIPRKEAVELIDSYFRLYPKVRAFMDTAVARAREAGYAVTALGRRRAIADINSRNANVRQAAERDAINTPIQGTAADLIKLAMVRVDRALRAEGLKTKMILQIHDELLFDVPHGEVERAAALVKREMEGAMNLGVPLEVSVGTGRNWLEAH